MNRADTRAEVEAEAKKIRQAGGRGQGATPPAPALAPARRSGLNAEDAELVARVEAIYARLDRLLEEAKRFSGEWLAWLEEELAFAQRYGASETVQLLEKMIEQEEQIQRERAALDLEGAISDDGQG